MAFHQVNTKTSKYYKTPGFRSGHSQTHSVPEIPGIILPELIPIQIPPEWESDFGWSLSQISFPGIPGIPGIPQESVEDNKDLLLSHFWYAKA